MYFAREQTEREVLLNVNAEHAEEITDEIENKLKAEHPNKESLLPKDKAWLRGTSLRKGIQYVIKG